MTAALEFILVIFPASEIFRTLCISCSTLKRIMLYTVLHMILEEQFNPAILLKYRTNTFPHVRTEIETKIQAKNRIIGFVW